jgi:hypothetical protein
MPEVRAVGMVIYTYGDIVQQAKTLWRWLEAIELWARRPFAEYNYNLRGKDSLRVWKANSRNRERLYTAMETEPWFGLSLGWPTISRKTYATKGIFVAVSSSPSTGSGEERYRTPSYLYLEIHPDILIHSLNGITGFKEIGVKAWESLGGVYGYIDVETGIPLRDNIMRNAIHLFDSTISKEHQMDYLLWMHARSELHKRVWKAFWGNFLGKEHIRQLGGIQEMRRANPRYATLPEYLERSYVQGLERMRQNKPFHEWLDLSDGGVFITLSSSPLDWFSLQVQDKRKKLQDLLGRLALGPWDYDRYNIGHLLEE